MARESLGLSASETKLAEFILQRRWDLKHRGIAKSKWRSKISEKFVEHKQLDWNADMFCKVWGVLQSNNLL